MVDKYQYLKTGSYRYRLAIVSDDGMNRDKCSAISILTILKKPRGIAFSPT
jgi:hypothetical protein